MFRMMALAVDGKMRWQRLATGAIARLKAEPLLVAGPRFKLKADLASCMKESGAGFYARQGWTGGGGIWSWKSEVSGTEEAGDVPAGQCPAPTGGNGEAQAGGRAVVAVPEEGAAGGIEEGEAEAAGVVASGEALEQILQACEQGMPATDEALSDLRGVGMMTGKRKRGDELAHQPVRHSLWEQGSLEAHNEPDGPHGPDLKRITVLGKAGVDGGRRLCF